MFARANRKPDCLPINNPQFACCGHIDLDNRKTFRHLTDVSKNEIFYLQRIVFSEIEKRITTFASSLIIFFSQFLHNGLQLTGQSQLETCPNRRFFSLSIFDFDCLFEMH